MHRVRGAPDDHGDHGVPGVPGVPGAHGAPGGTLTELDDAYPAAQRRKLELCAAALYNDRDVA